jgi:hypothetical protein
MADESREEFHPSSIDSAHVVSPAMASAGRRAFESFVHTDEFVYSPEEIVTFIYRAMACAKERQ